ncbi:MAG: hypothetical protein D6726_06135 [Nitrospirae bacterium]|nr:MAG: hypothetical protein D6726_06135 [Nitrospirota bacterium]
MSLVMPARAWHDRTHIAVARASGYDRWYNSTGADMAKMKAGKRESYNHYFDNTSNKEVTPLMVIDQAGRYNSPDDPEGHLYGAIIGALRDYVNVKRRGRYAEYHLAFAIHYMTDLCQPLHNMPFDRFNRSHHDDFDGVVDKEVLNNLDKIKRHMKPVVIRPGHLEVDVAREVARVANISRRLGKRLKDEGRVISKEEAYGQLGLCASLIKGVLGALREVK